MLLSFVLSCSIVQLRIFPAIIHRHHPIESHRRNIWLHLRCRTVIRAIQHWARVTKHLVPLRKVKEIRLDQSLRSIHPSIFRTKTHNEQTRHGQWISFSPLLLHALRADHQSVQLFAQSNPRIRLQWCHGTALDRGFANTAIGCDDQWQHLFTL